MHVYERLRLYYVSKKKKRDLANSRRKDNMPVDSETPVVILSISRSADPTWSFEGVHRNMVCVCVRVFTYVSVRAYL